VLDPNDRDAATAQLAHDRNEFVRFGIGEAGADLVEEQHARFRAERAREFEPFSVEQAQRRRLPVSDAEHPAEP